MSQIGEHISKILTRKEIVQSVESRRIFIQRKSSSDWWQRSVFSNQFVIEYRDISVIRRSTRRFPSQIEPPHTFALIIRKPPLALFSSNLAYCSTEIPSEDVFLAQTVYRRKWGGTSDLWGKHMSRWGRPVIFNMKNDFWKINILIESWIFQWI